VPRIKRIEICGFRSFSEPQVLNFESDLAVIWAANSQGKSSTAEALEFLLSGRTSRRDLLGGAKSEFERCLRNVHLGDNDPVWVSADIARDDGITAKVVRTLVDDYTVERECVSTLTVDGSPATDLTALGFVLSDPPTSAPVLLQHKIRFDLSSRQLERIVFF
jgi:DNA repair exonuclease SbcCD ATPase subunit